MTRFQTIFIVVLVALAVGGALLFALSKKNTGGASSVEVVMWGDIKNEVIGPFLNKISTEQDIKVIYKEKDAKTFENDLVAALASGKGPDLILLPQDLIVKQLDKFYVIPPESYSIRDFKDTFVPEGELYLSKGGIVGLPFSVDPLVMYWNRQIFTNAGEASPPTSWTDFFTLAPLLTKKDANGNIIQSLAALGEMRNVSHAKDIVALLAMQAGTPIVRVDSNGVFQSVFDMRGQSLVPAEEAVSFYTEFSNPLKPSYSWNRALAEDKAAFIAGKSAMYFGYASELEDIRSANPNLDYDVALMPQSETKRLTFGRMRALALIKASPNVAGAYGVALKLVSPAVQSEWVAKSNLPPVRRDMLSPLPGDAYKAVFYKSSLISSAWLDPYREATDGVFMRLIENVTSGKFRVSESVSGASAELTNLLRANL